VGMLLQIAKAMLDYRGRIQELRGLYKQYVSIEHTVTEDITQAIKDAYARRVGESK
jgi:hypothetical protein